MALYGATAAAVDTIRYPLQSGGYGTILPVAVPGISAKFFVAIVSLGTLADLPDGVLALDAEGKTLGRARLGPCDGSFDRAHAVCK